MNILLVDINSHLDDIEGTLDNMGHSVISVDTDVDAMAMLKRNKGLLDVIMVDRDVPVSQGGITIDNSPMFNTLYERMRFYDEDSRIIVMVRSWNDGGINGDFETIRKPFSVTELKEVLYADLD